MFILNKVKKYNSTQKYFFKDESVIKKNCAIYKGVIKSLASLKFHEAENYNKLYNCTKYKICQNV